MENTTYADVVEALWKKHQQVKALEAKQVILYEALVHVQQYIHDYCYDRNIDVYLENVLKDFVDSQKKETTT